MSSELRDFLYAGGFDGSDGGDYETDDALDFLKSVPLLGNIVAGAQNLATGQAWGGSGAPDSTTGQGVTGIISTLTGKNGGTTGGSSGSPMDLLKSLPLPPMPPLPMLPGIGALPVPPIPAALIPALGQGIGQATGITPASTGIGSLLGAGFGGLPFGTGPFPGALGAMMQGRFGQPGLPPAWAVEPQSVTGGDWRDAATHAERVGRAVVSRITGTTEPQLAEIRRWLRQRAAQIQATAEHRQVMSDADFKSSVIEQLLQVRRQLGLAPNGAAPVLYGNTAAGLPNVGVSKY
jgi:hypothetical protein